MREGHDCIEAAIEPSSRPCHEYAIALDERVPGELVPEVAEKLAYVSEAARSVRLADDGSRVEIALDDPAQLATVSAQVRETVSALVRGYREIPKEILWQHPVESTHQAPIWDDLLARGVLASSGSGCVTLLGDASRIVAALDRTFTAIAHDVFGAVDHRYPVLISRDAMERCDYFAAFPHHLTFAPHLRESVETLTSVANATREDRGRAVLDALSTPTHILTPAVCFHTYAWLADRALTDPVVITAVNHCFRWESTNFATCERLWDFSMREIVFAGDGDWVEARRSDAVAAIRRLVERLGVDSWLETANDPFFVTRFAAKRYFQLLTQAKFELRASLPYAGGSLAVASFNVHHDFFGRAFGVRLGDGFASTGCVAFGLERWMWALFAQHGPELAAWPRDVRTALEV